MELVEVILQGVRGTTGVTRWAFPAGVAVVPAGAAEQLCARAAFELLGCVADGVIAGAVDPASAGGARAAVILVGRDQRRYRLIWELSSGRRALQVMNGDKLEVVSTVQNEIAQALTAQVGFPQQDTLREVYFSFVDDLPSRRLSSTKPAAQKGSADKPLPPGFGEPERPSASAGKPLPPGFDGAQGTSRFAGRPEGELRARLEEIKARTSNVVDVSALEFELDGLQKKIFEIQGRKKPLATLDADIATIDDQLGRYTYLRAYPDDFLERAQRLQAIEEDHRRELEQLDRDTKALVQSVQHLSEEVSGVTKRGGARPLDAAVNDPLVRWGALAGLLAIVVAVIGGAANEALRWVAFLNIPAFGVAVFGGIKLLSGLEEGTSARIKLTRIANERRAVVERFEIDKQQIARLLEKNQLAFAQLPELIQSFIVRAEMLQRRATLARERDGVIAGGGVDPVAIDAELETTTVRIKALEAKLADSAGHYDPEAAELQREADEIERVLRGELKAAEPEPPPAAEVQAPPTAEAPSEVGVDVAKVLVRLASDLLLQSVDATATALAPRAAQMMAALTDGRCVGMALTSSGVHVTLASGATTPYALLPGADRDLVALAIRLAIVDAATKTSGRLPLVFDRVFDGQPPERAPLFVRALQFIGQATQVMVFTTQRELAAAGTIVQPTQPTPTPQGTP